MSKGHKYVVRGRRRWNFARSASLSAFHAMIISRTELTVFSVFMLQPTRIQVIISFSVCVRGNTSYRRVFCTSAAGVFVHCWSSLLSPICCYSLAWKQGRERFHTYTHWPLINKSDQGPFPHIHTTHTTTKTIHTQTQRLITETSQSTL